MRVSVAESVGEIVLQLCSCINRQQYLPKMPTRTELSNVFDPSLPDCQPYLFKVCRVPIRPGKPCSFHFFQLSFEESLFR
uniref:Secreted protein n=1 Tax=Angiostrongylus cantonensis TaxID=6313 RepID=A0A0K0DFS2_ANGCA